MVSQDWLGGGVTGHPSATRRGPPESPTPDRPPGGSAAGLDATRAGPTSTTGHVLGCQDGITRPTTRRFRRRICMVTPLTTKAAEVNRGLAAHPRHPHDPSPGPEPSDRFPATSYTPSPCLLGQYSLRPIALRRIPGQGIQSERGGLSLSRSEGGAAGACVRGVDASTTPGVPGGGAPDLGRTV